MIRAVLLFFCVKKVLKMSLLSSLDVNILKLLEVEFKKNKNSINSVDFVRIIKTLIENRNKTAGSNYIDVKETNIIQLYKQVTITKRIIDGYNK